MRVARRIEQSAMAGKIIIYNLLKLIGQMQNDLYIYLVGRVVATTRIAVSFDNPLTYEYFADCCDLGICQVIELCPVQLAVLLSSTI